MSALLPLAADAGSVLPAHVMDAGPVRVLAAFVAINTVMYGALAIAKILPRLHPSTWFGGSNRRAQERSIYPDGPDACPAAGATDLAGDAAPEAEAAGDGVRVVSGSRPPAARPHPPSR